LNFTTDFFFTFFSYLLINHSIYLTFKFLLSEKPFVKIEIVFIIQL